MKNYKLILTTALLTTMFGCVAPEHYSTPDLSSECRDLTANKTVQSIAATSSTYSKYLTDDIIEAYVTSSDEGGNFYKSISLVSADGTVGISIPIDDYNLFTRYEPGRKVYVNLKDLYIVKVFDGSVSGTVIGSLYNNNTVENTSDDEVSRLSIAQYKSILTPSCTEYKSEQDLIQPMTIQQAKSDQNLNKLISIDGVQFIDASVGTTYAGLYSTDHTIKDINENSLIVRISSFATFASKIVPSGNGKIVGVMTKYNGTYQFMIRTINDVQLNNPRVLPPVSFFDEPFTTNFNNWTKTNVSGAQVWTLDTQYGNPGSCAKMTGYVAPNNNANEDWLISPVQNLSTFTSATLKFDTATKFTGNALEVFISNNYTGNISTATWTPLTGILSPSTGNYVWTNSGVINISNFTGAGNNAVHVAFKFTSTASASATWEVDNVKIFVN
jgi:hypothetical protein